MWEIIQLELVVAGCPNRCRHCCEEGGPPYGALINLDDVKWLVDEFESVCQGSMGKPPQFRIDYPFEPTAHPDFIRLQEYVMSFIPKSRLHDFDLLNTNGYGLARVAHWESAFQSLIFMGIQGLGFAIHGLEAEHDWFVRRSGAYKDIMVATQRAIECGMKVEFEIHINKRNIMSFPFIVDTLEELGCGCARIDSGVPAYFMNDRLRTFEVLRPTKAEKDKIARELMRAPDRGSDTEAFWTQHLAENGRNAELCTYELEGKGPAERKLGRLRITPAFDVIELFDSRPGICHGNIKRDGIERVWNSVLETTLPPMPEPDALAHSYGDFKSEALHPGADSVYMKLCDKYWLDHQK